MVILIQSTNKHCFLVGFLLFAGDQLVESGAEVADVVHLLHQQLSSGQLKVELGEPGGVVQLLVELDPDEEVVKDHDNTGKGKSSWLEFLLCWVTTWCEVHYINSKFLTPKQKGNHEQESDHCEKTDDLVCQSKLLCVDISFYFLLNLSQTSFFDTIEIHAAYIFLINIWIAIEVEHSNCRSEPEEQSDEEVTWRVIYNKYCNHEDSFD